MRKLTLLLAMVFLATPASASDQARLEKAKAEGTATFYANITAIAPIMDAFAAKTGIKGA